MQEFQGQHLVDLGGVVPVSLEVSRNYGLEPPRFEIRPRQSASVQKHLTNIWSEGVPVPDPEVVELMPSEEQALEAEDGEEMIGSGYPLGHPGVIGVFRLEQELEETAR